MPRFAAFLRPVLVSTLMVGTFAGAARSHHGWSWAEGDLTTLEGTITQITIAPPHPELQVTDGEGNAWTIELGNPRQTERSGFGEGSAQPGDTVTVLGNRSQDESDLVIKAVRITIDGTEFDLYPERIPADA